MITTIQSYTPLGSITYAELNSRARYAAKQLDTELLQTDHLRRVLNEATSIVHMFLNKTFYPKYNLYLIGEFESNLNAFGLHWINLISPTNVLPIIDRIYGATIVAEEKEDGMWLGNCQKKSLPDITTLASVRNSVYRDSVIFNADMYDQIIFYVGENINTSVIGDTTLDYDITDCKIMLWTMRKVLLDNMVSIVPATQTANSGNYFSNIDIPSDYVDLVIKFALSKLQGYTEVVVRPEEIVNMVTYLFNNSPEVLQEVHKYLQTNVQLQAQG